ncbi:Myb-like DNA-binding domain containing protein [Tritrichomonas foetus]|uniref:Myb-like DNA-binding domain containing protein n=1 Tax=Tritrichomonas foetus TaxID=1144522 RepID=A0A1J4KZQ2_9EUKA|nr:Myb-like DNA-binding domain containing protein [Tritrichomonas foetus]|eukprot:OHT16737.1 Myb-like DNA-binding domain containing protein [Tritrichomonas foetus]
MFFAPVPTPFNALNPLNTLNGLNTMSVINGIPSGLANSLSNGLKVNIGLNSSNCVRQPSYRKCMWTEAEDKLLKDAVEAHGVKNWSLISTLVPGRNGKQCRERWSGMLDPDLAKDAWSIEEDQLLVKLHNEYGNKWAKISTFLPGRSRISLRNRWSYHVRHNFQRINSPDSNNGSSSDITENVASTAVDASGNSQSQQTSYSSDCFTDEASASDCFSDLSSDEMKEETDPFNFIKFEGKSWEELDQLTSGLDGEMIFEPTW